MTFNIDIPIKNIKSITAPIILELYKSDNNVAFVKTFHAAKILQTKSDYFSYKFSIPGDKYEFKCIKVTQGDVIITEEAICSPSTINHRFHIVVACYNAEEYIRECLFSVIKQTHTSWSIAVIDDGSTDNTRKYVEDIKQTYPLLNIQIYSNPTNQGIGYSKRVGCNLANPGDVICILDGDDYLFDDKVLESINDEYNKDIRIGCVYTNFLYLENNQLIQAVWLKQFDNKGMFSEQDVVSHFLTFKKDIYDLTTGYECYRFCTDKLIISKLTNVTYLKFLDRNCYVYRKHAHNVTNVVEYVQDKDIKLRFENIKAVSSIKDTSVSIIIAHHNRNLLPLLTSLNNIKVRHPFEVIIISTSRIKLYEELKSWCDMSCKFKLKIFNFDEEFNKSKMLNLGALYSENNKLFFCDADMTVGSDFIDDIKRLVSYNNVYFPICKDLESGKLRDRGYGNCGIMKRDFYRIQQFDEDFLTWGGEDTHFYHKCLLEKFNIVREELPLFIHLPHEYNDKWHSTVVNDIVFSKDIKEYRERIDKNVAFFKKKINEYQKKFSIQS